MATIDEKEKTTKSAKSTPDKTKIPPKSDSACKNFSSTGQCRFGDRCSFRHNIPIWRGNETGPPPIRLGQTPRQGFMSRPGELTPKAVNDPKRKRCMHFQKGNCKNGESCNFFHDRRPPIAHAPPPVTHRPPPPPEYAPPPPIDGTIDPWSRIGPDQQPCPSCKKGISRDMRFCGACGFKIKSCPSCEAVIFYPIRQNFCGKCGISLKGDQPPPHAPPPRDYGPPPSHNRDYGPPPSDYGPPPSHVPPPSHGPPPGHGPPDYGPPPSRGPPDYGPPPGRGPDYGPPAHHPPPQNGGPPPNYGMPPNAKTKPCREFAKGTCKFGERCHYAHGPPSGNGFSNGPPPGHGGMKRPGEFNHGYPEKRGRW